jgi:ubiquinone/menaquinone biosynthesis C-methylase UbiE
MEHCMVSSGTNAESGGRGPYIHALRFRWLNPLYDRVVGLLREREFKTALLRQADIQPGSRVLDLGCGTGTLTLMVHQHAPGAEVVGLDGDRSILDQARAKAHGVPRVRFDAGLSFAMPYPDASFDRVLSSWMFHHLTREDKARTLREVLRVLKPGGELHVADWGKPQNALRRAGFLVIQLLDGFRTTRDSVQGVLPQVMHAAGFQDAAETARFATPLGSISLYRARKPA